VFLLRTENTEGWRKSTRWLPVGRCLDLPPDAMLA
jgi:hypothetical protein